MHIVSGLYTHITSTLINMGSRSTSEILKETFGTDDRDDIYEMLKPQLEERFPPLHLYTKLELPYKAPSCPPIPSFEETQKAFIQNRLTRRNGLCPVCRVGACAIKYSTDPVILQVCRLRALLLDSQLIIQSLGSRDPALSTGCLSDSYT